MSTCRKPCVPKLWDFSYSSEVSTGAAVRWPVNEQVPPTGTLYQSCVKACITLQRLQAGQAGILGTSLPEMVGLLSLGAHETVSESGKATIFYASQMTRKFSNMLWGKNFFLSM